MVPMEKTAKYGTDALRLALSIGIPLGTMANYQRLRSKVIVTSAISSGMSLASSWGYFQAATPLPPLIESPADEWILAKIDAAVVSITKSLEAYRYSEAGQLAYSLLWDEFADWYINLKGQSQ